MPETDRYLTQEFARDVYRDIGEAFLAADGTINAVLENVFSGPGRCVRPRFMGLTAELVGGTWKQVRDAAVVVEAIHLSSLLHDDVVDNAELRRGTESLNARYSDKISILFGDHIFVTALARAAEFRDADALAIIHRTVKCMVEGEIHDTLVGTYIDEAAYLDIIGNKTAALFAAAGELGVLLSGVNGTARQRGRAIGELLGTAFQIVDDALDYDGDRAVIGKPVHKDVQAGVMTLPLIHALDGLSAGQRSEILSGEWTDIVRLVEDRGGVTYARRRAVAYLDDARRLIASFGNDPVADVFDRFLDTIEHQGR